MDLKVLQHIWASLGEYLIWLCTNNKGPDQQCSLIRAFDIHFLKMIVAKLATRINSIF